MNAGRVKLLTDKLAMEYAQLSTPTGELHKAVVHSNYLRAKQELHDAIDAMNDRIRDAFFDGYASKSTCNGI